ncbi:chromosome segregation protein Csm1/Pcs1-domain-containing protein [Podospora fimiseda]|uniref:Chromosome segregation protein Csm1/Pcs1-domain-containing protein n=1 Tax=Podospora fimiseda TaxID=252190 RepID=A0AAN7BVE9_9PEZI|nr:chromosome segregation protein Csm1/Pcs1-domain-containing protein [Podospora fimiseda]
MSKSKIYRPQLLELVDSDSDDGLAIAIVKTTTTTKSTSTMPSKKKAAGRPAAANANKVTKPAQRGSATRSSGRTAMVETSINVQQPKTGAGAGRGRKQAASTAPIEEEEEEEEDIAMDDAPPAVVETKSTRGRPKKASESATPQPAAAPIRGQRGRKPAAPKIENEITVMDISEIPETQPAALMPGTPASIQDNDDNEIDELSDLPALPPPTRFTGTNSRGGSAPPPGSASSSSRARQQSQPSSDDPALRRRLGELTAKNEALETKYRDLREITINEAERNFDRYKKQTEEKSKLADTLISSLKSELASHRETTKEIARLQSLLTQSETLATNLQAKVTSLSTALSDSKTEIKALNMKLTASRNAEAAANARGQVVVPGSAMKGSNRMINAIPSEQTFSAQKKEDLYGDLTGLIVRSVKKETGGGGDMFDCIQTGRNGTLHFKLTMGVSSGEKEAQCEYSPLLDANRDRALIEILPEFLVDEIAFPRSQAGRFYQRVMKALNDP